MLIRSQDKTALIKFENIVVNLKLPDSLTIICWSLQDAQRSGGYFILGKYSTESKAMKVLDMIQDLYTNEKVSQILSHGIGMVPTKKINEAGKIIKNIIQSSTVFQMPEDSEVKV